MRKRRLPASKGAPAGERAVGAAGAVRALLLGAVLVAAAGCAHTAAPAAAGPWDDVETAFGGRPAPAPAPRPAPRDEALIVLPSQGGAVNPGTGRLYPRTPAGLLNPDTGQIYPRAGRGYINPRTGQYFPAPAGSGIPR